MLREIGHFVRHVPYTFKLKVSLPHGELYDHLMAQCDRSGMERFRASLVAGLDGRVLEIGSGTGLMFRHYSPDVEIDAIEPDASFLSIAARRAQSCPSRIAMHEAGAEELPFEGDTFDGAVVAMVLCSVPRVPDVLRELHRVLKPGAPLRLIEHVCSKGRLAGALMHLCNPVWRRLNGVGCNMNRDPLPHFASHGFAVESTREFQVFSPGIPAFPMVEIRARRL